MIFYYIKAILFIVCSIGIFSLLGCAFTKRKDNYSKKIIFGYLIFSFLIGIPGVIVQTLSLPWIYFATAEILIIIFVTFFSLHRLKKQSRLILQKSEFLEAAKKFIKEHWFIFALTSCFLIMAILSIDINLLNNHLDDGLYLLKSANAPYTDPIVSPSYATGFEYKQGFSMLMFSYSFNVFDLEASVFIHFLNIPTTIFTRFSLNWINYFIFLNSILWFAKVLFAKSEIFKNKKLYQYLLCIVIIFGFYPALLSQLINMSDDWQFNTAMWYGSSIVRCAGLFIMLTPLLEEDYNVKDYILFYLIGAFALFTKSSIALPLLCFAFFAYLIKILYIKVKKYAFIGIGLFTLTTIFFLFFGEKIFPTTAMSTTTNDKTAMAYGIYNILISNNLNKVLFISSIIIIAISFIKQKNKKIIYWNLLLLIFAAFMLLPIINLPFLYTAMFSHVANRMATMFTYTIITTASIYLLVFLYQRIKKEQHKILISLLVTLLLGASFSVYFITNRGFRSQISYVANNPLLMPDATYEVSQTLEQLYEEKGEEIFVLAPEFTYVNNYLHGFATMVRIEAPHVYCLSAWFRYSIDTKYMNDFEYQDQLTYQDFIFDPEKHFEKFKIFIDKNPFINCFIAYDDISNQASQLGFKLQKTVNDGYNQYTIYIK